jgi:predicted DNA-binding WGR domain protein
MGKKKYKTFGTAAAAVAKKKGISKKRAKAYVATVERAQGKIPGRRKKK